MLFVLLSSNFSQKLPQNSSKRRTQYDSKRTSNPNICTKRMKIPTFSTLLTYLGHALFLFALYYFLTHRSSSSSSILVPCCVFSILVWAQVKKKNHMIDSSQPLDKMLPKILLISMCCAAGESRGGPRSAAVRQIVTWKHKAERHRYLLYSSREQNTVMITISLLFWACYITVLIEKPINEGHANDSSEIIRTLWAEWLLNSWGSFVDTVTSAASNR